MRKSLSFCRKQANLETLLRLSGSSPTVTTHHSPEPSTDGRPLLTGDESKEPGAEADDNLLDELVDIAEAVKKGVLKP